jgi:hypothetical protein
VARLWSQGPIHLKVTLILGENDGSMGEKNRVSTNAFSELMTGLLTYFINIKELIHQKIMPGIFGIFGAITAAETNCEIS